jgi:hypothetical protein
MDGEYHSLRFAAPACRRPATEDWTAPDEQLLMRYPTREYQAGHHRKPLAMFV